jgi:hypothetical protein
MRAMISAAAVAAATVLTAAGCGGAGGPGGSGGLGAGASVVPANTVAFVALDTDVSSGQWQAVDQLLQKFPQHDQLLSQLQKSFEQKTSLSWNDDVKPALGSELDLALLPGASAGAQPQLVFLTQPADSAKFSALLARLKGGSNGGGVSRQIGGWTVAAESTAALDAVQNATATLSADNTYQDASAHLAGDSLARAFANGAEAQQLLGSLPGQSQVTTTGSARRVRPAAGHPSAPAIEPQAFQWGAADVVAVDGGVKVEAFARSAAPVAAILQRSALAQTPIQPYTAQLIDEIPAGPLFVADFQVAQGEFELTDPAKLPKPIQQLLQAAPQLSGQLDSILGGETAIYVRPSLPVPEVTLVTQPADTQAAVVALDSAVAALKGAAAGAAGPLGGALGSVQVYHALLGGELVVSTSQQGIADFRSAGPKLSADAAFTGAMQAANVPQQTTGFVYVNLEATLPLVEAIAALAGVTVPPALQGSGLQPLRTLTAFADRTRDESSFTVFLAVK